jgi:phosphate:Na+ symporter
LNAQQNRDIYQILHVITDLERISDHALNIAENAREIQEKKIVPTEELRKEMGVMNSAVFDVLTISLKALEERDLEAAYTVEPLEERIDNLCDEIKHRQIERMTKGIFTRQNSFVFTDLITNYERISDHCSNIALSVIEATKDEYDPHNYVETLMSRRDENFEREYQMFKKKYSFD